jgi:predicted TIM-barrel enzyme
VAITLPLDARYVQERTDAVGFIGASSMERLPVETAIAETVRQLKSIPVRWRP